MPETHLQEEDVASGYELIRELALTVDLEDRTTWGDLADKFLIEQGAVMPYLQGTLGRLINQTVSIDSALHHAFILGVVTERQRQARIAPPPS